METTDREIRQGQRLGSAVLFLIAALLLAFGLVYSLAAIQNARRLLVSIPSLACGICLAAWLGLRWRRARQLSPQMLESRIVAMAAAEGAEVTIAQVISMLGAPEPLARASLQRLEAKGLCHPVHRDAATTYRFPGLEQRKVVRRCAFCGSQYSVRNPIRKCTNCGGELEIVEK